MIAIFVCLLQITVIAGIASVAAKVCLDRSPQLSARFCWLGIFLSAVVVLATYFDAPRLWTLQTANQASDTTAGQHSLNESVVNTGRVEPVSSADFKPPLGFTAQELLQQLSHLRNRHPVAESRLVSGCSLIAALLCLVILGRCVASGYCLWRLRNAQRLPEESPVYQELARLSAQCGISFAVEVRRCELLSSPCVSWLSRGTIYVPDNFEQWKPEERRTALAHELIHEVRRDPQSRFFAELCLSLLCYHPLMLLLRRQLIFAQELATDRQAARLLGSVNAYQRGLSLLALRMDSQRTASYLVSVSTNDVIRRIKMLSSTRPSLSRRQEVVSVAAILFVSGIAAAWTANADEPIRLASRQKIDVSDRDHQDMAETILPWEQLGEQDGFVVFQPGGLIKHPVLRLVYEAHVTEALEGIDLNAFELTPENIKSLQLPLILNVARNSEEQRLNSNGDQYSLHFGANAIAVETRQPVAWKKFAESLPPLVGTPEESEWLESAFARFDQQTFLRLVAQPAKSRQSEHSAGLRSVWGHVNNCALAIASMTPDDIELRFDDEVDLIDARALFSAVDSTAIGVALDSGDGHPQIRIAFAPREGRSAAEVLNLAENTQAKMLATGKAVIALRPDSLSDEARLKAMEQLLDDFGALTLEIAAAEDGSEIVLATTQITADLAKLLP